MLTKDFSYQLAFKTLKDIGIKSPAFSGRAVMYYLQEITGIRRTSQFLVSFTTNSSGAPVTKGTIAR